MLIKKQQIIDKYINDCEYYFERKEYYKKQVQKLTKEHNNIIDQMNKKLESINHKKITNSFGIYNVFSLTEKLKELQKCDKQQIKKQNSQTNGSQNLRSQSERIVNEQYIKQIQKLKKRNQEIEKQNKQLKKQLQQQKTKIKLQIKETTNKNKQKQKQLKKNIKNLQNQHTNLSIQLKKINKQYNNIKNNYQIKLLQYNNICQSINQITLGSFPNRFFVCNLIQNQSNRQFIINQLNKLHPNTKITKTKLIYNYPQMKYLNIHNHLDNIPNYIFIITIINKDKYGKPYLLALYSAIPLDPKNNALNTGKGFVASVTNQQTFYMVQNDDSARLTEYNDYYIVFGKGEIQFKINTNLLQFNIGHNYKSINAGTHKTPKIFTGETDKSVEIEGFEVYQIIF